MQRRIVDIRKEINSHSARTVWDRGVRDFAVDMFNSYVERREINPHDSTVRVGKITEDDLLDGAKDWSQYSRDGKYLIYNGDICKALCSQKEQRRTKYGELPPNDHEDWMDVQAKALAQASQIVINAVNRRDEK